jgi:hypothetical protein
VKAPPGETGDFGIAHRAEAVLYRPEKSKHTRTLKRLQHMIGFAFFEVGFIGRIVRVCVASDLDMSTYGSITGRQQPCFEWLPLVIVRFSGEDPVSSPVLFKVFLFDPALVFLGVSSPGPSPKTQEDFVVHASKDTFARNMPMIICPTSYLGVELLNQIGRS